MSKNVPPFKLVASRLDRGRPPGRRPAGLGQRRRPGEPADGCAASGAIAAGCAACGSFFLVTLLSFFGATGALALLPLRGGELGLLSMALLLLSIFLIARRIVAPAVCEIRPHGNTPVLKEQP